jgi:DNA primase large subunit
LLELINSGFSDNDVVEVFRNQKDFNEEKIKYFIEHARKKGYKPFSHKRLKEILEGVRS